jgi:hypothetical protein
MARLEGQAVLAGHGHEPSEARRHDLGGIPAEVRVNREGPAPRFGRAAHPAPFTPDPTQNLDLAGIELGQDRVGIRRARGRCVSVLRFAVARFAGRGGFRRPISVGTSHDQICTRLGIDGAKDGWGAAGCRFRRNRKPLQNKLRALNWARCKAVYTGSLPVVGF